MSERITESNLAARVLFEAAFSTGITNLALDFERVPGPAAEALIVWSRQRGVPIHSIDERVGLLQYGDTAVYCFRFVDTHDRYNGVVCIDGDGMVLAEDSRVSPLMAT